MLSRITFEDAPGLIQAETNRIARRTVAVVGLAMPYNDIANKHDELIRPGAFGRGPVQLPPLLFDTHPKDLRDLTAGCLGDGVVSVSDDRGLFCVWELAPRVAAFDRVVELAADGAGLSVSFTPEETSRASIGGRVYTEHTAATLRHVAFTPEQSYENARVLAIKGPFATMLHQPRRGVVVVGPRSTLVDERQQVALSEYAATGDPRVIPMLPPAVQRFEADRVGRR